MDLAKFLKVFEEQFFDTAPGVLSPQTVFKDNPEWSSLTVISVIVAVDETFSKTLSGDDFQKANTIEDLFKIAQEK